MAARWQWVQLEISRVQHGKPGNFLRLVSFTFQYSSVRETLDTKSIFAPDMPSLGSCLDGWVDASSVGLGCILGDLQDNVDEVGISNIEKS